MTPTPYALRVQPEVHRLVHLATAVLTPEGQLDLANLDRTFTIQSHDALIMAIAPGLLASTQRSAPGVSLRFLGETPTDTSDLRHGRVDLQLGATRPTRPELQHEVLGAGHFVIALRDGHPLLNGRLTLDRYAGADHIVVSRRGRLHDLIDDYLHERSLRRRVIAAVPNIVSALRVVQSGDTITAVPAQSVESLGTAFGLRTVALPMRLPPILAISAWHQRYDNDPAHSWLRRAVRQAFESS